MSNVIKDALNTAEIITPDEPQPLIREVGSAAIFPVHALGEVLGGAALAIQDITQAPLSMCSQSVLAAATLAAQGLADVQLPRGGGKGKPMSGFFVTVAATGERKSTVDTLALAPIREWEAALRVEYTEGIKAYNLQAPSMTACLTLTRARYTAKNARLSSSMCMRVILNGIRGFIRSSKNPKHDCYSRVPSCSKPMSILRENELYSHLGIRA